MYWDIDWIGLDFFFFCFFFFFFFFLFLFLWLLLSFALLCLQSTPAIRTKQFINYGVMALQHRVSHNAMDTKSGNSGRDPGSWILPLVLILFVSWSGGGGGGGGEEGGGGKESWLLICLGSFIERQRQLLPDVVHCVRNTWTNPPAAALFDPLSCACHSSRHARAYCYRLHIHLSLSLSFLFPVCLFIYLLRLCVSVCVAVSVSHSVAHSDRVAEVAPSLSLSLSLTLTPNKKSAAGARATYCLSL